MTGMADAYQLSVVVCTYDRYDALQQSLEMLLNSRGFNETSSELVIVENTPIDRREALELPDLANVRMVVCEEVGLSAARNFGIDATSGSIVAFLDDDALVCEDWCALLIAAFDELDVLAFGGKVVPEYPMAILPAWFGGKLPEYLSCIDWGPRPRRLNAGEWLVGANCAFRRSVFDEFGRFDTNLGRKGGASLLSNDEGALVEKFGLHRVFYSPEASVRHIIPADRMTPKWFRRRAYWQAISDMVAGTTYLTAVEARREYGELIGKFEAERRNLNALFFAPENHEQFAQQLRAVYLAALVFGDGGV
jgi:glycosyltransferase involved in cell wall biosynthesis